ncbi:MAG: sensor domain-containing phosphodiesterase [Cellulomonas sp.]
MQTPDEHLISAADQVDKGSAGGSSQHEVGDVRELDGVLARRDIGVVFQPVVDLQSREVVGLEALARGPRGTALADPAALFAAARRAGRVAELDWVCRAAAFEAFVGAGLPPSLSLFLNVEPEAFAVACPPDLLAVVTRAESMLRVFVEVNDRALATDPAGLLAVVDRARASGWGVALDDVGSSRDSMAVMPVIGADVIKLDLRLLRQRSPQDASAITMSVLAHTELTGASLLVEGIESEDDAEWARAVGATYGQGYHVGVPGPLADRYPVPRSTVPLTRGESGEPPAGSPFAMVADLPARAVDLAHADELAQLVYRTALVPGASPVILACSGRDDRPQAERGVGYPELGTEPLLAVLFGEGLPVDPIPDAPGLRGVRVPRGDPLVDERFLVVLCEKGPFALLGWSDPSTAGGQVEVVLTQDPDVVHRIARHLIRRLPPPGADNEALPPATPADPVEGTDARGTRARSGWRDRLGRRE